MRLNYSGGYLIPAIICIFVSGKLAGAILSKSSTPIAVFLYENSFIVSMIFGCLVFAAGMLAIKKRYLMVIALWTIYLTILISAKNF